MVERSKLDDIESVANLIKILKRNPEGVQGEDYKQSQIVQLNNRKLSNSELRKIIEMSRNNNDYDYYFEEDTKSPEIMELIKDALKHIRKVTINRKFRFTKIKPRNLLIVCLSKTDEFICY